MKAGKRNNLSKGKTMKSRKILASLALILVLGFGGGSAWALDWFVDIVDGEYPDSEVGMWTNVVCDSQDRPRCSYYEGDDNCLKYAAWNGTSWDREVVDEGGPTDPFSVGRYNCMVIDSEDRCHISYRDRNKFRLKYAVQNGSGGWDLQVVDDPNATDPVGNGRVGVGRYTSIDLDSNEYPHISYVDLDNGCLKYARWNGSSWEVENVYCTGISLSITGTSIQIDSNDHPHIAFGDTSIANGGMVASWNGSTWTFVNIKYYMDISTYMAIDCNDDLHITIGGGIYIRTKGTEWIEEWIPIASPGGSSIRLDKNGYPRICHTGSDNDIWYLYFNGTEWIDQFVDGKPEHPESGEERCIGLDSKGIPYITYFAQKFYDKQQIRIASIIPPKPDSDDDGDVDWSDLKAVVNDWLWSGHPGDSPGDIICDGVVKLDDFAAFAAPWLEGYRFQAYNPSPADFAEDVDPNVVLSWTPADVAVWHDVYFGTDFDDVNNATDPYTSPGRGRQDTKTGIRSFLN